LKVAVPPFLFSAAVLGLLTLQSGLERKSGQEKGRLAQAALAGPKDGALPGHMIGLKLQEIISRATQGDMAGQVEMGRRFAEGQGVRKDEAQAARYFQAAIAQAGNVGARDKRAPVVAAAFRYLSHLHRHGVASASIPANPAYAFDLLHHAASYFGDPQAQFELAKLLLAGEGVTKNSRAAAQWLYNASRKGHAPSQALLGEMMWRGNGVARAPGDGLGLLAIARRNASPEDRAWVSRMFETARSEALPAEILEANAFIVQESNGSRFGPSDGTLIDADGKEPVTGLGSRDSPTESGELLKPRTGAAEPPQDIAQGTHTIDFGLNIFGKELLEEKPDPKQLAGLIRMYRPWDMETGASPVRIAGVSK
jgi:TPR repeat protein